MRHIGKLLSAAVMVLAVAGAAQADVTFLDHRGKTITLKEPPKRIVSMFASGPLVHTAVEGTDEHFVGVNVKAKKTYENGIYAELLPDLLKLNFDVAGEGVGSSRVDLQACKLEYSIVSPK